MGRRSRSRRRVWPWLLTAAAVVVVGAIVVTGVVVINSKNAQTRPTLGSPSATSAPTLSAVPTGTPTIGTQTPDAQSRYTIPPLQNGMVPVITRVPTKENVVFLTIDDGAVKKPEDVQLLKENGIKPTMFLAHLFIQDNPGYFKQIVANGGMVENHTWNHNLNAFGMSYANIKNEICPMQDYLKQNYNRVPQLMRPPGGPYSNAMRRAAADCGIKAIIDWSVVVGGKHISYQEGNSLKPGDIVLMHFRDEFAEDLAVFIKAQKQAGMRVELLENYVNVS